MRQQLANLGVVFVVGGCSLIYNPSNISKPPPDAAPKMDAPPPDTEMIADANPKGITILDVFPKKLAEGAGIDNSRPAVFVLSGHNFIKSGASISVAIAPTADATLNAFDVSSDGDYIVVSATVPVDGACDTGTKPLTITVSESDGMGGTAMATSPANALAVNCLPQLVSAPASSSTLAPLYSKIMIGGDVTFAPSTAATPKAVLRSVSSISLGNVVASASARGAGPGGGVGGDDGATGGGPRPGIGSSNGGGGGGFVVAGTAGVGNLGAVGGAGGGPIGDTFISSYGTNASSGGGGGSVGVGTAHTSGGGGGGGLVELTASGDVTAGTITVNGGNGSIGNGLGATAGGAGTGGVVLVRTGAMLTLGTLSAAKGQPAGSGGVSSDGRLRVDSAKGTQPANAAYAPMFVGAPSLATSNPALTLRGMANDSTSTMYVYDKDDNIVANMTYTPHMSNLGNAMIPTVVLKIGYNKVCVTVAAGTPDPDGTTAPEANNCIEIGYAP